MSNEPIFPRNELDRRLAGVRQNLVNDGLDGIVITVPENIYYLTGLDHWGVLCLSPACCSSRG